MEKYTTEYLILHEDEMDWEKISGDKFDSLSFIEIRLFRKRINWKKYLITHQDQINTDILEIASKHFTPEIYEILACFGIATEEFIESHIDEFKKWIVDIIKNCNVSEEFILKYEKYWNGKFKDFGSTKYIKLDEPRFSRLKLFLEAC